MATDGVSTLGCRRPQAALLVFKHGCCCRSCCLWCRRLVRCFCFCNNWTTTPTVKMFGRPPSGQSDDKRCRCKATTTIIFLFYFFLRHVLQKYPLLLLVFEQFDARPKLFLMSVLVQTNFMSEVLFGALSQTKSEMANIEFGKFHLQKQNCHTYQKEIETERQQQNEARAPTPCFQCCYCCCCSVLFDTARNSKARALL